MNPFRVRILKIWIYICLWRGFHGPVLQPGICVETDFQGYRLWCSKVWATSSIEWNTSGKFLRRSLLTAEPLLGIIISVLLLVLEGVGHFRPETWKDKQVSTGEEGSPNPAADHGWLCVSFPSPAGKLCGNWGRHFFAPSWGNSSKVIKTFWDDSHIGCTWLDPNHSWLGVLRSLAT